MPTCPYCQLISPTRRSHVLHLADKHANAHALCIARSRGATISSLSTGVNVPSDTTFGPVKSHADQSSQISVPSIFRTVHCTVCFEYESNWIPAPAGMELRPKCYSRSRYCDDYCTDQSHERHTFLYCRGGVCWYPHDAEGTDDRIRDWGSRGRVGNVYCKGHKPYLCPADTEWLNAHFSQASMPERFSTRLPQRRAESSKPVISILSPNNPAPFINDIQNVPLAGDGPVSGTD